MSEFNSKFIKYLCLLLFLQGCAYFNTFYNAEDHFSRAEQLRVKSLGQPLSSQVVQLYGKAIEKSEKVLREYSDSRYVLDAKLIKGKSHFYRREYDSAKSIFAELSNEKSEMLKLESKYWLALCKWKDLKPQPAISDLEKLMSLTNSKEFQSQIALSIGEISLEIDNLNKASINFNLGAELSKNRILREQVYFQLAEISFEQSKYEDALSSYKKVLNNTISPSRIRESNLKIVQIYRLQGNLDMSSEKIKELLIDNDFNSIKGDLELELVKIELQRGKIEYAIENLDRIGQDYPNTKTAIESYYILSNIYLKSPNTDFERAQFFMNESMRQNNNSEFKVLIGKKRDDVNKLIKLNKDLSTAENDIKPQLIFNIGEILAFNLSSQNEAVLYFEEIIKNYPNHHLFSSAVFSIYLIYDNEKDKKSSKYENIILSQFPNSDFSKYIFKNKNSESKHLPSETLLMAESKKNTDIDESLNLYKKVININNETTSALIAAFYLANYYDFEISDTDSAKYYYEFLERNHPFSEQGSIAKERLEALSVQ